MVTDSVRAEVVRRGTVQRSGSTQLKREQPSKIIRNDYIPTVARRGTVRVLRVCSQEGTRRSVPGDCELLTGAGAGNEQQGTFPPNVAFVGVAIFLHRMTAFGA